MMSMVRSNGLAKELHELVVRSDDLAKELRELNDTNLTQLALSLIMTPRKHRDQAIADALKEELLNRIRVEGAP